MRFFRWVTRAVIFLLLLSFSLRNTHVVMIDLFPGFRYQQPLVVVLLVAFALGVLVTVAALLPRWLKIGVAKPFSLPVSPSNSTQTATNVKSTTAN